MSEIASEIRAGLDNLADAIRTLAGAACTVAAGCHSETDGRQAEMAGVFYHHANQRFGDVLRKLDTQQQADLNAYIAGLCTKRKRSKK